MRHPDLLAPCGAYNCMRTHPHDTLVTRTSYLNADGKFDAGRWSRDVLRSIRGTTPLKTLDELIANAQSLKARDTVKHTTKIGILREVGLVLTGQLDRNNASILVNLIVEGVDYYIDCKTIQPLKDVVGRGVTPRLDGTSATYNKIHITPRAPGVEDDLERLRRLS